MYESEIDDPSISDREVSLLSNARGGANSSLGELMLVYRDYLFALADDELGSDLKVKASASDLVQDSFVEAKRDFRQFTGDTPIEFQRWLRKLLLNNVANVVRGYRGTEKRNVAREVSLPKLNASGSILELASDDSSPSSIAIRNELFTSMQAAMQMLPQHYQDVIQWRNYDRITFQQIGLKLGRSTEAAQQLWVRALDAIQKELDWSDDSRTIRSDVKIP